jgi:hypothetical protein
MHIVTSSGESDPPVRVGALAVCNSCIQSNGCDRVQTILVLGRKVEPRPLEMVIYLKSRKVMLDHSSLNFRGINLFTIILSNYGATEQEILCCYQRLLFACNIYFMVCDKLFSRSIKQY